VRSGRFVDLHHQNLSNTTLIPKINMLKILKLKSQMFNFLLPQPQPQVREVKELISDSRIF
jgi:hypothetical protein